MRLYVSLCVYSEQDDALERYGLSIESDSCDVCFLVIFGFSIFQPICQRQERRIAGIILLESKLEFNST
jgi:hypothetical protein